MPANGDEVNSDSPASCRKFEDLLLPHGRGMQSCTCHRYWMRQILYYSYSFRATGGRRKRENRIKHRKRTQTKTSQMSSTWQGPKVTLSVPGAAVNYLLTPWTRQSIRACCDLGFLCVSMTEVFCKSGQREEEILFALEGMPLQFCMWHNNGKFLFLPPSLLHAVTISETCTGLNLLAAGGKSCPSW